MALQVIEGTWEEIERHKAELIGRQLRVTIKPDRPLSRKRSTRAKQATMKELSGYGMLAGVLSTEDYFREKLEDTAREDRML